MRKIICFSMLLLLACGPGNDPRDVAEAFCNRYFVELNQPGALEISSGLAAEKLRKEIELLKGEARSFEEGDREFHRLKPFISFKIKDQSQNDAEHAQFLYEIMIEPKQSGEKMTRQLVLNLQKHNGRWSVNNYDVTQ